ncbi:MAG: very short patch repair endonuclease [Halioglobus sp.]
MDNVDSQTRSRMMSGIKGRNTKPELILRSGLQRLGFRHRLGETYFRQGRLLPGRPDLVFPKYRAVIQVNGCFWHRHDCHLFKWPETRAGFWRKKLSDNAARDARNQIDLESDGWRVLTVWECALKGRSRRGLSEVINTAANWLQFDSLSSEISGVDESRDKLS